MLTCIFISLTNTVLHTLVIATVLSCQPTLKARASRHCIRNISNSQFSITNKSSCVYKHFYLM